MLQNNIKAPSALKGADRMQKPSERSDPLLSVSSIFKLFQFEEIKKKEDESRANRARRFRHVFISHAFFVSVDKCNRKWKIAAYASAPGTAVNRNSACVHCGFMMSI